MERRRFGTSDLWVSPIGFGTARIGGFSAAGPRRRTTLRLLEEAFDRGINTFDTADAYAHGDSEQLLGEVFRNNRDRVVLATKGGYCFTEQTHGAGPLDLGLAVLRKANREFASRVLGRPGQFSLQNFSRQYLTKAVDDSLRRLRTTYIDLYQLHAPRTSQAHQSEVIDTLEDLRKAGKIRYFGVGLETLGDVDLWLARPGLCSIQIPFGVGDPEAKQGVLAAAARRSVAVIARGVFSGGLLKSESSPSVTPGPRQKLLEALKRIASTEGRSVFELALRYVVQKPEVSLTLIGIHRPGHLATSLAYLESPPLDAEVLAAIDAAIDANNPPEASDHRVAPGLSSSR